MFRGHVAVDEAPQRAPEAREEPGDDKCIEAVTPHADADHFRAHLVVPNGLERLSEGRPHDGVHGRCGHDEHRDEKIVIGPG